MHTWVIHIWDDSRGKPHISGMVGLPLLRTIAHTLVSLCKWVYMVDATNLIYSYKSRVFSIKWTRWSIHAGRLFENHISGTNTLWHSNHTLVYNVLLLLYVQHEVNLPVLSSLEPTFALKTNIQDVFHNEHVALCLKTYHVNTTLTIIIDNSLFKPAFCMSWNREWQNIVRHFVITIQLYVLRWNISWEYSMVSYNTFVLSMACSPCVSPA